MSVDNILARPTDVEIFDVWLPLVREAAVQMSEGDFTKIRTFFDLIDPDGESPTDKPVVEFSDLRTKLSNTKMITLYIADQLLLDFFDASEFPSTSKDKLVEFSEKFGTAVCVGLFGMNKSNVMENFGEAFNIATDLSNDAAAALTDEKDRGWIEI